MKRISTMRLPPNTKLQERGFASIAIALVLIVILALLTVGFAQLARREQQSTLDKQKATQARYAAESGINNAYKDILSGKINSSNASLTNCMKAGGGPSNLPADALSANQNINSGNGVSYSCLLVQLKTDDLQFNNVLPNSGRHMMFSAQDTLSNLKLSWGSATNRTNFASSLDPNKPTAPTLNNWLYPPVIEFNITPVSDLAGQPDPAKYLRDHTFTFYAYPSRGGSNVLHYNPANQGQVVSGNCSGSGISSCSITLDNLSDKQYVIHFVDFYDASNILITGKTDTGSNATFEGEPIIDVTGKSRDVLKRLRARVLINGSSSNTPDDNAIVPNFAVEAQNICKRIQAGPATTDFPAGSTYDTTTDASCNLSSN